MSVVPERPDLSGWTDPLVQRIENAELQVLNGKKPVEGLADLSRLYHANGFYSEAALCYQGLISLDGKNGKWPHRLAEILSSYGKLEEALPFRLKVVELDPKYVPGLIRLGELYLKLNRFDEADALFQRALQESDDEPHAFLGIARAQLGLGNLVVAQEKLEEATRQSNGRIGTDLLASVYDERGLTQNALEIRRIKIPGSYSDIYDPWMFELNADCFDTYQLAVAAGMADHRGDNAAGIRILTRAIHLSPRDGSLHFQMGQLQLKKGDQAKAIESFKTTTELQPDFSDGWFQLAQLYERAGDQDSQARAIAEGLFHNPDSPGLHISNAKRLKESGDIQASMGELETAIKLRPEEADPYVQLAALHIAQGENEQGLDLMRKALTLESLHPVALSTLIFHAISVGNEQEAKDYLTQARLQPRIAPDQLRNLEARFRQRFGANP
ncbi:MAG: tetratricopeptide repeat protein [Verrucomicrobiae bacterium]|nr:tetratricopeptide repeat protein [Verrucomicrobiae bacterium]